MAVKYGFFDSVEGDRTYNANDLNKIFAGVRSDGVVPGNMNEWEILAGDGMNIVFSSGLALINGKWCDNSAAFTLPLTSGGTLDRIDGIFLHLEEEARVIVPTIKQGTPSASPVKPEPINSPDVKELALAYVHVPAGATSTASVTIEDARTYSGINSVPRTLLWQNDNPSADFAEQEITLAETIDSFETIMVETTDGEILLGKNGQFKKVDGSARYVHIIITVREFAANGFNMLFSAGQSMGMKFTSVHIDGSTYFGMNEFSDIVSNNFFVPKAVYGINRI